MSRRSSSLAIPEELRPAIVTAPDRAPEEGEGAEGEGAGPAEVGSPESGVWRTGSAHIAHVLAGDDGVEEVEVSVHCPHCNGAVLIDVANEDAFMTALSMIADPEPAREALAHRDMLDDELDRPLPNQSLACGAAQEVKLSKEVHGALRLVPVARVMQPSVVYVRGDASVSTLPAVFSRNAEEVAVVTDTDERPIGTITPAELMRAAMGPEQKPGLLTGEARIDQIMIESVRCLRMDAPVTQALALFATEGADHVAVIGDNGKLAGILHPVDVLRFIAQQI